MEDKIFRDKIIGLETLPDGYNPSLQSKWDLLETSLAPAPEKKRNRTLLWMAASFLIISGIGWLSVWQMTEAPADLVVEYAVKEPVRTDTRDIFLPEIKHAPPTVTTRSTKRKEGSTALPVKEIITPDTPPVPEIHKENIVGHEIAVSLPSPNNVPIAHKKRYVEIDFGVPATRVTPEAVKEQELTIKLRLGSSGNTSRDSYVQYQSPLKVQKSF